MPWYKYSNIGGNRLPIAEVLLWHGAQRVRLVGIVDSGADISLIDAEYALLLGLNRAAAQERDCVTAGGSKLKCLRWPEAGLQMQFGKRRFPFEGVFAEFPAGSNAINLFGRGDFFQRFTVTFWDRAGLMNVDSSPTFARSAAL